MCVVVFTWVRVLGCAFVCAVCVCVRVLCVCDEMCVCVCDEMCVCLCVCVWFHNAACVRVCVRACVHVCGVFVCPGHTYIQGCSWVGGRMSVLV